MALNQATHVGLRTAEAGLVVDELQTLPSAPWTRTAVSRSPCTSNLKSISVRRGFMSGDHANRVISTFTSRSLAPAPV